MCGIAGYIVNRPINTPLRWIPSLLVPIRERGPDDEGVSLINLSQKLPHSFKTDRTVSVLAERLDDYRNAASFSHDMAFLHTRFSIIDLSYHGHQPFFSSDGTVVGIYNGEIYNYIELRNILKREGVVFKTACDTEVLIEGYRVWGEKIWEKLNGFWAVVLYDRRNNTVVFSRDRLGIAPLYYRNTDDGLFFSSAIQSLIDIDPSGISVNRDAAVGFMQTGIKDHEGTTFYNEICTFPAASYAQLSANTCHFHDKDIQKFWNLPKTRLTEKDVSFDQAVKTFQEYFFQAVERRLRADVKVAFELSGGMDSSSVVAAAATLRGGRISTYTAKIKDADEEPFARSMLSRYQMDYHVIEHVEQDFAKDVRDFTRMMEEPFDNPNAYTHHHMLRHMKREGVHVVITGAGGDEVFAGYEGEFWPTAYRELRRQGPGSFLHADLYEFCRRYMTRQRSKETLIHYVRDFDRLFRPRTSPIGGAAGLSLATKPLEYFKYYKALSFHEKCLFHFTTALLPFYMRSTDHFTMSVPIEHRFPFLDYHMVEIGLQAPVTYLFKNGWTKYLMRKAMEPYLPAKIVWRRKKMGFAFPYKIYLTTHRQMFEPFLNELKQLDVSPTLFGTYDELLRQSPSQLWRILSVGVWLAKK